MSVQEARQALAVTTKRGIPLIMAGVLFWMFAGISQWMVSTSMVPWVYVYGVGVVFPLGILLASLMKIDIFAKGNPLGSLLGFVGSTQILFVPVIILFLLNESEWVPFVFGILTGAHFLPYAWAYNSKSYLFLSIGTVIVSSFIGLIWPEGTATLLPFALVIIYFMAFLGLWVEGKKDFPFRNNIAG